MVKGKYINEKARTAYKKAEKKIKSTTSLPPEIDKIVKDEKEKKSVRSIIEGPLHLYKEDNIDGIKTDMLNMMEEIDKMKMSIRVIATRLNRVDGMGK